MASMNAAAPQQADAPNEIELCQFPAKGDKPMARIYACGGDDQHYANLRIEIDGKRISMTPEKWSLLVESEMSLREQLREVEDCLALTHKALRLMADRHREPEPPGLPERYTVSERPAAEFA
jgi:hypothetical protein